MKIRWIIMVTGFVFVFASRVQAQQPPETMLIPIGGGYSDIYAGFSETVISRAQNNLAKILVLPTTYSSNPFTITEGERAVNIQDAEARRYQIEEACKRAAPPDITCIAALVPIFVRSDTENRELLAAFSDDLTAVFILGGDQTIAMQVIANTPVEQALEQAYQRGVIVAGTSAGGGMQSLTMMGGYSANFPTSAALNFGAADVWNNSEKRGLFFGVQHAILDQHFFQRGRVGRLLNAIALPGVPHVGVGIDAYTGVHAPNGERLENVFGLYTVAILDAETYHAADAVEYIGSEHALSLHNVLVHLLSPGDFSYNLVSRQHSLATASPRVDRADDSLNSPPGSGALFLGGDLSENLEGNPTLARFVNQSGGAAAKIAVVASGYPSNGSAQRAADKFAASIQGAQAETFVIGSQTTQTWKIPENTTGIILIGRDQSTIQVQQLSEVKEAWLSGIPVMADNAAAAIIGAYYSAHGPTPDDVDLEETATQRSFLSGLTTVSPGLGLLDIMIEPQLLDDNRWGRFFSLAYNHPQLLAIGLNKNAVIEITSDGAVAGGANVTFVLDLRTAALSLGTNRGFVIANGLLDVFVPNEVMRFAVADVTASPIHAPTPILATKILATQTPTATFTYAPPTSTPQMLQPSITSTLRKADTRTPRPTNTPPVVPPAADPVRSNWMIFIAILAVMVVFIGVWINWRRVS